MARNGKCGRRGGGTATRLDGPEAREVVLAQEECTHREPGLEVEAQPLREENGRERDDGAARHAHAEVGCGARGVVSPLVRSVLDEIDDRRGAIGEIVAAEIAEVGGAARVGARVDECAHEGAGVAVA